MRRKILLVSQVYAPDPAAVARLIADVGAELARRGNEVVVLTANRGYDDPDVKYASSLADDGVEIRRLPLCSFGKGSMFLRVLGGLSFTVQAAFRSLLIPGLDTVVVSTSPPMASLAAVVLGTLRRVRVVYWPMDLNPDQVVALGLASDRSPSVRVFEWLNRAILRRADIVIALDRAMARRLERKRSVAAKLVIVPPWPEEDDVEAVPHAENPFRRQHGLDGKTVIMYSGTLGPSNPVTTILEAAERFEHDRRVVFLFVGGGTGMAEVKSRNRPNVRWLPYEPLSRMRFSLSAGDVQLVSLGDGMGGIVHPCKVYGAMATSRPILFLGPPDSHVSEMMSECAFGWEVRHGDVDGAVQAIREIADAGARALQEMGARARELVARNRTRRISCGRVCDAITGESVATCRRIDAAPAMLAASEPPSGVGRAAGAGKPRGRRG
jgi:glycosyltransferase involved in cell wall biosynthesis